MNLQKQLPLRPALKGLAIAVASVTLSSPVAQAMPYATSLTNNAGVVSFRLNQTTATNDTVLVISSGGTVTNVLQAPGADPTKVITRGLVVTNLGIASGAFQVVIKHIGSGQPDTNSPIVAFNAPRGVAVNNNPSSPYFGWVYVANSAAGTKGDGIFAFSSDLTDILGQGATARTGGYAGFAGSTTWSPYRISVAPDDKVLVCDDTDATANLLYYDPLLTAFNYVLKPIASATAPGNGAAPVGADNIHGSIAAALIVGTGANRVLYTIDEDYQTDPTTTANTEWNSLWKYDIGASSFPWSNAPAMKLMTPYILSFSGQNQDLATGGPKGYLYVTQRRANANQYGLYVVDPANPIDPASYAGGRGGYFWNSQDASHDLGWPDDLLRDANGVAVSQDGRYVAITYYGGQSQTNTLTGETWNRSANDIVIIPTIDGIPNMAQRTVVNKFGTTAAARGLAFDAANNLYIVSSGHALLQSVDIGESGTAVTGSSGTFELTVPSATVSINTTVATAYEQGTVAGQFTLQRVSANLSTPLTVFYTIGGTASNGVDYVRITNQMTFPANVDTLTIDITPIDDTAPELMETVVLSLVAGAGGSYNVGIPKSGTVTIVDNEPPQLRLGSATASMFEANGFDYSSVVVQRAGDTNTQMEVTAANFVFSGTAVLNADFVLTNLPVTIDYGVVEKTIPIVAPIDNSKVDGTRSIQIGLKAGSGFTVATNTVTTTIIDDDEPTETVLWSDKYTTDTSANYKIVYGATNSDNVDYSAIFSYDYSALGIPPAPHSSGDTLGLRLTVNKGGFAGGSGVNLYPIGKSFSGNFALRFDMFLLQGNGSYTTEYALFGINHSGNKTNWFRNSTGGVPAGWTFDGLFYDVEADAAALGDYVLYSGPITTDNNPTALTPGRNASTLTDIFKAPPWSVGADRGGAPANLVNSTTPCWAQVEVSQVGNIVTLKINNTEIFAYTNTTAYTSGNIMLGYDDAYDSLNGSTDASVIFDNVRVVRLGNIQITSMKIVGGNAQIDFAWGVNDPASTFVLQSASNITGPYTDVSGATMSVLTPGQLYRAEAPVSGPVRFYRIRYQ